MNDPHDALAVLAEQRHQRQRFARSIKDSLDDCSFYTTSTAMLARTIRQALHEDEHYETLTGEPMPAHHQDLLRAELAVWMRYDDLLHAPTVSEDQYAAFCDALKPAAAQLAQMLALAQAVLTTPLVVHYALRLKAISDAAPANPATRNPPQALRDLQEDRRERAHLAHNTYRHLLRGTYFATGTTDLTYAIKNAAEDARFYEDATGERFPPHAQQANHFEVSVWTHLLRTHERGTQHPTRACMRLLPLGRILERTIELENDLLTNPLTAYYERRIRDLAQAAHRADRRFTEAR